MACIASAKVVKRICLHNFATCLRSQAGLLSAAVLQASSSAAGQHTFSVHPLTAHADSTAAQAHALSLQAGVPQQA